MPVLVTKGNISLHYEERGSGRPILLIHGWGMSARVWASVMEKLSDTCRVIAVDLRGHGFSSHGDSYSLPALLEDLELLIHSLDLSDTVLVGWSLGGQIALAAVPSFRERLSGLVLVGATPKFTSETGYPYGVPQLDARGMGIRVKRACRSAMEDFSRNMFTQEEWSRLEEKEEIMEHLGAVVDESVLLPLLDTLIQNDLRNLLPEIDLPVLLVHGSIDRICLPGASQFMADRLPHATLHLLHDAGHAPFLSRPDEFIAVITPFLKRTHEQY